MSDDEVGIFEFDDSDSPVELQELATEDLAIVAAIEDQGFELAEVIGNDFTFAKKQEEGRYTGVRRRDAAEVAEALKNGVREHEDLLGIISPKDNYVELAVREARRGLPISVARHRWAQAEMSCQHAFSHGDDGRSFHISGPGERACIEYSPTTAVARFLLTYSFSARNAVRPGRGYTLKIFLPETGDDSALIEEARNLTERFCFELDAAHGIQMVVVPRERFRVTVPRKRAPDSGIRVRFPKMRIPREVSALFSFAGEAADNPPFMFLSYYQVLEYYLPLATQKGGLKAIRRELQSLNFDEKDDASILRLLNCADRSRHSGEEEQMKTLVTECVRGDVLREFFTDAGHGQHFTRRGPISGVPAINISSTNESLEVQVAKRIYALRNRIVHAKDDPKYAEMPVLLPRSREAGNLAPDIHLARLLAIEVVVDSQG